MDFMKVFDQTVREIKREVNLKVLKVPEIEQKVLDATDDEPWGPHGTALAEIAQATKKFSETQMVMNVLWTRLSETGKNWRLVYKALTVIEYLVGNGSERAVDDIIEHTFQISSLSSFEYVEPSGKDMGINVRKKAENIVALLNNKDKIQEVRNKAATNREKYFGLSSTGITYKSGSASYGSGSYNSSDSYQGQSSIKGDRFQDRSSDNDSFRKEKDDQDEFRKSSWGTTTQNYGQGSAHNTSKDQSKSSFGASKKPNDSANQSATHNSAILRNNSEEDFDDFDPRGTSTTNGPDLFPHSEFKMLTEAAVSSPNEVDLFGDSLIGDLMDAPTPVSSEKVDINSSEVDLFADATFVSASPQLDKEPNSQLKTEVDLFASQPASVTATVDFFASPEPVVQTEANAPTDNKAVDPFAALPLNYFDGSDLLGATTSNSNSNSVSSEPTLNPVNSSSNHSDGKSIESSMSPAKKNTFQVKSGIWADSLSRGLIDLNISAPKKVSLVDVGVVGALSDLSDVREKGPPPTYHMGKAMGTGSGIGRPGAQQAIDDDFFSQLSGQQYQFGAFQK